GLDGQVMAADDGIVLRIPHGEGHPGGDLSVFTPGETEGEGGRWGGGPAFSPRGSAEGGARALLLPGRAPTRAAPLWRHAPRTCSRWRGPIPISRSCSRPRGSACRTSTTCPP